MQIAIERTRQPESRVRALVREAGISPVLAGYEANRPFWQPLRDLRD